MGTIFVKTLNDVHEVVIRNTDCCKVIEQETSDNDVLIVGIICITVLLLALIALQAFRIYSQKKAETSEKVPDDKLTTLDEEANIELKKKKETFNLELLHKQQYASVQFEEFCYTTLGKDSSVPKEIQNKCWEYLFEKYGKAKPATETTPEQNIEPKPEEPDVTKTED